jgi:IclR family transcriptional regulator, acetate operon repressor
VGKAYLSTLDDEEIVARVGTGPFERHTPRSITDLKTLRKDIAETRSRGFAINCEESDVGVGAIAAPICTQLREVKRCVGLVSIAAPISRISCADLAKRGPRLMEVCRQLAGGWPLSLPVTQLR